MSPEGTAPLSAPNAAEIRGDLGLVASMIAPSARVSFAEIVTDKGHDAFLLEEPELFAIVRGFLEGAAKARGLPPARG
jgi:homoserine O-acetyltransferase